MHTWRINIKKSELALMVSNIMYLTVACAIMVGVMAGVWGFAEENDSHIDESKLSEAAKQGSFASTSGFGADLNKEQWHEDPFADEAAAVRAAYDSDK